MSSSLRITTLVLVNQESQVLGSLAPFEVEAPNLLDMEPVVRRARGLFGIRVAVLRLLSVLGDASHQRVTYLAEVETADAADLSDIALTPWDGDLEDDPKRLSYARVGGPARDLAWATEVLRGHGQVLDGEPTQVRTWNLSSVWKVPASTGCTWLKVVPPFFQHEGDVIRKLSETNAGRLVPRLIGHDGPRVLLAHVEGEDRYNAPLEERLGMIDALVELQFETVPFIQGLLSCGVPDWRTDTLASSIRHVVERRGGEVNAERAAALHRFVDGLANRFEAVAECGLPDTLVHGDFHPGNVRGDGNAMTIIDWGDSGIGNPMLDQPPFFELGFADERETTASHWAKAWRRMIPGSDPRRAAALLAPIAAARRAVVYQLFLDQTERSEHVYHHNDVGEWLVRTASRCFEEESASAS